MKKTKKTKKKEESPILWEEIENNKDVKEKILQYQDVFTDLADFLK